MNKKTLWILVAFFAVSCSTGPQNVMTPSVVISTNSLVTTDNFPDLPLIASTASRTPAPTAAETVTLTPDSVLLTQDAVVSSCEATERTWYTKHLSGTYFRNEQWGAVICSDNGVYTKIWNVSLNLTWNVPSYDDDLSTPEPSWYWVPYLWSDNGRYLCLQAVCLCNIDSPWLIYLSGYGLTRLDLSTGQVDIWLKPSHNPWYNFAFTDDGNLFAFSPPDLSDVIKIRNLINGDEQSLVFKEKYVILEFRWSSDNSRLIIFTEEHETDPAESGFSIFVYNVKSEILRKLIDRDNLSNSLPTEDYIEPRIFISDLSDDILTLSHVFGEVEFQLNIKTGELTKLSN